MRRDATRNTVVLWTESYPYTAALEHTFLRHEIPALKEVFRRVILVPGIRGGSREDLPVGVEVDESYALQVGAHGRHHLLTRALRRPSLLGDLAFHRPARSVIAAKRLITFAGSAEYARRWAIGLCRREHIDPSRCVFYTYWWTPATTGFGLAKSELKGARVVTRAHGYDLYEERHVPAYIPCRSQSIRVLDALYPDSDRGREYLEQKYRHRPPILQTARLGVRDPGTLCSASDDRVFRVVSCSLMVPVKRLDRLVAGLTVAGHRRPHQRIEWTHFGTGPLHDDIKGQARTLPTNVVARFPGYSTQDDLFAHYAKSPIDVFVNVSSSEGTAVSIMEAIASGIPIVATAVGGNTEIVTSDNGQLVGADASPDELGTAFLGAIDDPERSRRWRAGSRRLWRDRYDADQNFGEFAKGLISLGGSTLVGGRS